MRFLASMGFAALALGAAAASGCGHTTETSAPETTGGAGAPSCFDCCDGCEEPPPAPHPTFGATVTASDAPPPISGGTLIVLADGNTAVAADPDRDVVYVVDVGARVPGVATTCLRPMIESYLDQDSGVAPYQQ
ncbi:MAG TPA: hypothetical protein VHB21_13915, partial [Minicystis sp.]|nr:hypothetical protein [Minicystis sp.]